MKSFGLTDKGMVRRDNQDSFIIEKVRTRDCLIVALCDGMGGAKAGGLASQIANRAFVSCVYGSLSARGIRPLDYEDILKNACREANGVAYEFSQFGEEFNGMGTTIVGGVILSNGIGHIINVGDSRAYLISGRSDAISQITRDHSLVEDLLEHGVITAEQAKTHPQRNIITRAVGTDSQVEADYFNFELSIGDVLLLCSDGLSNTISDEEMLEAAKQHREPEDLCRALMELALSRGARDNVTVLAVK